MGRSIPPRCLGRGARFLPALERRLRNLVLRQRLVVASLRERNGAPDTEPTAAHASRAGPRRDRRRSAARAAGRASAHRFAPAERRSEEHTSELQSRLHLVCRLLLEKKKNTYVPRLPYSPACTRSRHPI